MTVTVTLLCPTYNEIDGMKAIMPLIDRKWCDQILILDGGSTDGTVEYARDNGYEVLVQSRPGLINAYRECYPHIRGEILITFSPDGNSVADKIPPLIEKMKEGYDMVIVSRYLPGARSDDDTKMTAMGNWVFTKLINTLFHGNYTDAMVMFRAYRTKLIEELGLMEDGFVEKQFRDMVSWEPWLSMRAAKRRVRIGEIPGDEPARVGGVGKCKHYSWGAVYLAEMVQELLTP